MVDGAVGLLDVLDPEPVGGGGLEEGHVEPRVSQDQGRARRYRQVVVAIDLNKSHLKPCDNGFLSWNLLEFLTK